MQHASDLAERHRCCTALIDVEEHLFLVESNGQGRRAWLAALDTIDALKRRAVIAGHGVLDPDNDPRHIDETRQYIHDFDRLDRETTTARDLYDRDAGTVPRADQSGLALGECTRREGVARTESTASAVPR